MQCYLNFLGGARGRGWVGPQVNDVTVTVKETKINDCRNVEAH